MCTFSDTYAHNRCCIDALPVHKPTNRPTNQAFDGAMEKKGLSIAVAIGFIPALASWALTIINTSLQANKTSLGELYIAGNNTDGLTIKSFADQRFFLGGVIALSQGFVVTSIVLTALMGFVIEKNFLAAAVSFPRFLCRPTSPCPSWYTCVCLPWSLGLGHRR